MKTKRVISLLVCLCMLCCLLPALTQARADNGVIFFVINNVVSRPLNKYTMPEVIGGEVYVPYSSLSSLSTVSYYYDTVLGRLFFYRGDSRLTFDIAGQRTFDEQGSLFRYAALYRNGTVYIPIGIVCAKFDLYCTFTDFSTIAPMLRINEGEVVGTDLEFTSQLYNLLSDIYDTYLSSAVPPEPPAPTPAKVAYLTFTGVPESPAALFSALSDTKATFFLTPSEMEENGSFIRQALSLGHSIGVFCHAESPTEQLSRANEILRLSLSTVTRTVCIKQGVSALQSADRIALVAQGVRFWDKGIDLDENYQSLPVFNADSSGTVAVLSAKADFAQISSAISGLASKGFVFYKTDDWHEPINNFYSQN